MKAHPLEGRVCLVAGATRGAGRGISIALGEAGATVYCSGRSAGGHRASNRPETVEETAALVTQAGGRGLVAQTDHTDEAQVQALLERIRREHGGLDLLVNDVWGGDELTQWNLPFWEQDLTRARTLVERGLWSHIITARHGAPLLFGRSNPLLIEVTDGDGFGYRGTFFYDLVKFSVIRLAFDFAAELAPKHVTALAITPGFLRSEAMLEHFGVTEATWRDGAKQDPNFIVSETPRYVGRAIAALAADPDVHTRTGRVFASWTLAREYGFTDVDGARPMWDEHFKARYGEVPAADYRSWERGQWDHLVASMK
jgi:NAD(P)-dependent dehydrogenase (short-subunit alcohol dehydrogenase family)